MSLHKIGLRYMGMTIWVESDSALDKYEESHVIHSFNRDFAYMLRAVGADVRAHFMENRPHDAKESNPTDHQAPASGALVHPVFGQIEPRETFPDYIKGG